VAAHSAGRCCSLVLSTEGTATHPLVDWSWWRAAPRAHRGPGFFRPSLRFPWAEVESSEASWCLLCWGRSHTRPATRSAGWPTWPPRVKLGHIR
jgi:hypothetical protein